MYFLSRTGPLILVLWTALVASSSVATPGELGPGVPQIQPKSPAATSPESPVTVHRDLLNQYCVPCHNDAVRVAGLSLSSADLTDVGGSAEVWEKVLLKAGTGQMPPFGSPQPSEEAARAFTSWLEMTLDRAAVRQPNPGYVGIHRLNRGEYANAVRDLLSLEIDTRGLLLPDESEEGFDNVAAGLTVSPAHFERYLTAARKVSQLAVGDPTLGKAPGFELYQIPKLLVQDIRVSDDLPFGSRGGIAVRHRFPLDGDYAIRVRLRRQIYDYIIGMGRPQQLDVRIDGKLVQRLTVGGEGKGNPGPLTWNGEIVGDTEWEMYMHSADERLEVRVPVQAGTRVVGISFVDSPWESEGIPQPPQEDFGRGSDEQYDGYAAVDRVAIGGPYNPRGPGDTPSRRAIFVCRPERTADEEACARKILQRLADRGYRRTATSEEVQTLLGFYRTGRKSGFEAGIQSAIERLLVSFNFLFRVEEETRNSTGAVQRLSDIDLASRLSFFLWSSIPDEALLADASRGRLREPAVLERQVRRMLADERSDALIANFASQWLNIRRARSWQPDARLFPEFDEGLREAMLRETELFVTDQFRQDRSVVDLIGANYSFVNERLARHYGIRGVYGDRLRPVTFDDGVRGGLLGQASILMVTSYPDRTSPVVRGKWLLDNMLGMPPPPPLPNVPELVPRDKQGRVLSIREQLSQHRENPACASCHVQMDPLGFALENFDALGQWRHATDGVPVDSAAVLPDGTKFDGVQGLRAYLVRQREEFVRTFTTKLLTYALGRGIEYYDYPAVRKIARVAAATNYRWSDIILGIVKSTPFQMRRTPS